MNINFLSQINPKKFLEPSYLFEAKPDPEGLYQYLGFIFGILIILALILIIKTKKKEEIWKSLDHKIINLLVFVGFAGFFLIFFRFEGISYLGSRLFLAILLLVAIIWVIAIVWYRFKILPKKIEEYQKKKIFEKYLP